MPDHHLPVRLLISRNRVPVCRPGVRRHVCRFFRHFCSLIYMPPFLAGHRHGCHFHGIRFYLHRHFPLRRFTGYKCSPYIIGRFKIGLRFILKEPVLRHLSVRCLQAGFRPFPGRRDPRLPGSGPMVCRHVKAQENSYIADFRLPAVFLHQLNVNILDIIVFPGFDTHTHPHMIADIIPSAVNIGFRDIHVNILILQAVDLRIEAADSVLRHLFNLQRVILPPAFRMKGQQGQLIIRHAPVRIQEKPVIRNCPGPWNTVVSRSLRDILPLQRTAADQHPDCLQALPFLHAQLPGFVSRVPVAVSPAQRIRVKRDPQLLKRCDQRQDLIIRQGRILRQQHIVCLPVIIRRIQRINPDSGITVAGCVHNGAARVGCFSCSHLLHQPPRPRQLQVGQPRSGKRGCCRKLGIHRLICRYIFPVPWFPGCRQVLCRKSGQCGFRVLQCGLQRILRQRQGVQRQHRQHQQHYDYRSP